MLLNAFAQDRRGSASMWFAIAAVAITAISVLGAQGLAWIANSGRVPVIAFVPLRDGPDRIQSAGVDMTATGSIKGPMRQAPAR